MTKRRRNELTRLYQNRTVEELRANYDTACRLIGTNSKAQDHKEILEEMLEGAL
jgi:hypothetical protein